MCKDLFFYVCIFFLVLKAQVSFAYENDSPGCAVDFNIHTNNYDQNVVTQNDIDSRIRITAGKLLILGIVAQNVTKLKFFQVKVHYSYENLNFLRGDEDFIDIFNPNNSRYNLLKKNGESTLWISPTDSPKGCITLSSSISGNSNEIMAPDGSGFLGFLYFKVLNNDSTIFIILSDVHYVDIYKKDTLVVQHIPGIINFDIIQDKKIGISDVISIMNYLSR